MPLAVLAILAVPGVLAVHLGPALAAGGASAAKAATRPPSAAARLIASEAAHDARASQPKRTAANSGFSHASCGAKLVVGTMSCFALKRDGVSPMAASASPDAIPAGHGYGPSQLQSAYNLTAASAADGAGQTVAIVDFFDDPNAASDLATYRAAAGLPPVPSFEKVNQEGQTSPLPAEAPQDDDWTLEESADLDMVSAICPECNIVLVEADNDYSDGGDIAQNTAAGLAGYISDSWGSAETSDDTTADSEYFDHPGVVTTVAGGDGDYGQISYPATSPNVVSVGGTTLSPASNARGWAESVWSHDGAGCSAYEPQPSWQTALDLPAACSNRIDSDVSADADPNTGVAVYDTANGNGGWMDGGGTSVSAPMVAAMYALAAHAGATPAEDIYTHTNDFYDITSGSDGTCSPASLCTAETGYDAPSGIGTPDGIAGLVSGGSTGVTSTTNLALNQPATASSSYQTYAASNATDGNTGTYWESTDGAGYPQTVTVDLGSVQSIGSVTLDLPPSWTSRTETLSVLGSGNGSTFSQIVGSAGYTFNPSAGNTVTISLPPGTSAGYVELSFTGNTGWSAAQLSEFEVFPGGAPASVNLARNQPSTASGQTQAFAPANAVDGDTSTYWESTDNALPQWFQVDLGSSTSVGRIVMDLPPTWTTRTQTITIQGSADGTNYTTLAPSAAYTFDPSTGNTATVTFTAASVRYVKLTFTANTGWPAGQLSELQAYAS